MKIHQPPTRLYGYEDAPLSVSVVEPGNDCAEVYTVQHVDEGWYVDVEADKGGRDCLVYFDETTKYVKLPAEIGTAVHVVEDE